MDTLKKFHQMFSVNFKKSRKALNNFGNLTYFLRVTCRIDNHFSNKFKNNHRSLYFFSFSVKLKRLRHLHQNISGHLMTTFNFLSCTCSKFPAFHSLMRRFDKLNPQKLNISNSFPAKTSSTNN